MPSFSFLSGGIMASRPRATDPKIRKIFQRDCFMVVPQARRATANRVLRPAFVDDEWGLPAGSHRIPRSLILPSANHAIGPSPDARGRMDLPAPPDRPAAERAAPA